ncbi:MAG: hypothetical protein ACAI38_08955 [Myxococcota bacterium]|nr:hypothetical protein [Myxococcota bacterium]
MNALILATLVAAFQPPVVKYVVSVETRTWKPIELKDVERILDNAAVSPLLQRGDMQLVKSDFAGLKQGDYTLLVSGRFIEEAEDFSIYMTFGPGKRQDLPSFHVSGTEPVGKRGMQEMQRVMEKLANQVANRLNQLLAPELRQVALPLQINDVGEPQVPQLWQWPKLTTPDVPKPSKLLATLIDPRNHDSDRLKAVTGLSSAAFDELAARKALERCVLRDPSPAVRLHCLQELEPVARVNVQTQRVLLYAMRNEYDDKVLGALARVSQAFTGLSRAEALDTWLFLIASPGTPAEAVDDIANVLGKEGNVPNLDVAVASCLRQGNSLFMKKYDCANDLLRILPPERRAAVAYDYLEHADSADLRDHSTMKEVMDWLIRDNQKPEGRRCDVLTSIVTRSQQMTVQSSAAYALGHCADPTPAQVDKVAALMRERGTWHLVRALSDMADKSPQMKEHVSKVITTQLDRLTKQGCTSGPSEPSTRKELQEALDRLNRRR